MDRIGAGTIVSLPDGASETSGASEAVEIAPGMIAIRDLRFACPGGFALDVPALGIDTDIATPDAGVARDLLFAQAAETGAALPCVTHDREFLPRFDRAIDFADLKAPA